MFWFGLISALACLHVAAPAAMDQHQLELKEHYEHLAYIAEFPCHDPQPRVFSVHELFSECKTHGKAYFPDVTVLHHCGSTTGCCTSGNVCVPTQVQTLHLPFKVTYLEDMEHHKKGSWEIKYYTFENHTHCSCEDVPHTYHHEDHSNKHPHNQESSPGKGRPYTSSSGYEEHYGEKIETSTQYGRRPVYQNKRPGQFNGSQGSQSSQRPGQFSGSPYSGSQSSQRPGQFSESQFPGSQFPQGEDQFSGSQSSQRPGQSSGSQFSGSQFSQGDDQFSGYQSSQRPSQSSGSQFSQGDDQFSGSQSSQRPGQSSGSQFSQGDDQYSGSQSSQRPGQSSGSQFSQGLDQYSGSQSSQRPGQSGSLPVFIAQGNDLSSTEPSITSTTNVEDLFSSLF